MFKSEKQFSKGHICCKYKKQRGCESQHWYNMLAVSFPYMMTPKKSAVAVQDLSNRLQTQSC